MLTTNKAVYGTDGSLTELGRLKGSGGHSHNLLFESERIVNTNHDIIHTWNISLNDFSFNDSAYDDKFLMIVVDATRGGNIQQYTTFLPPNKSKTDGNYLQIEQVASGGINGMLVCDGGDLEFYTYKTYDPDATGYIEDFKIYIYLM